MTLFWSRANEPIEDTLEWARKFEDPAYRFVALDVEDGWTVSTIWQGLDLAHSLRPDRDTVMIFETALFGPDEVGEDRWFWHSEEEALAGHDWVCAQNLNRPARPEDGHLATAIAGYR